MLRRHTVNFAIFSMILDAVLVATALRLAVWVRPALDWLPWSRWVTYIHVPGHGWWYAVTVIDYFSRYLLGLRFTHSYSAVEAIAALKDARAEAERLHGPLEKEPFLVTDNGTSFISRRFKSHVQDAYAHVRIQYRTPTQLGLLERFHESLKQEEVYWRLYESPQHARECLAEFRQRYNHVRPHWALVPEEGGDPLVPADVYESGKVTRLPRWQGCGRLRTHSRSSPPPDRCHQGTSPRLSGRCS